MNSKFKTPGETTEEREEFWLDLIAEARNSSGGVTKFCRDRQIGKEVYYHWFGRLKDRIDQWQTPLATNKKQRKSPAKEKSRRNVSPPRTRKEWANLVALCNSSGLTPSAFARKNNLNKVTFCRWYKRSFSSEVQAISTNKKTLPAVEFVAVNVIDKPSIAISGDENLSNIVEIYLANKRMLRVRPGCTPDFLKTVISILEDR